MNKEEMEKNVEYFRQQMWTADLATIQVLKKENDELWQLLINLLAEPYAPVANGRCVFCDRHTSIYMNDDYHAPNCAWRLAKQKLGQIGSEKCNSRY